MDTWTGHGTWTLDKCNYYLCLKWREREERERHMDTWTHGHGTWTLDKCNYYLCLKWREREERGEREDTWTHGHMDMGHGHWTNVTIICV